MYVPSRFLMNVVCTGYALFRPNAIAQLFGQISTPEIWWICPNPFFPLGSTLAMPCSYTRFTIHIRQKGLWIRNTRAMLETWAKHTSKSLKAIKLQDFSWKRWTKAWNWTLSLKYTKRSQIVTTLEVNRAQQPRKPHTVLCFTVTLVESTVTRRRNRQIYPALLQNHWKSLLKSFKQWFTISK